LISDREAERADDSTVIAARPLAGSDVRGRVVEVRDVDREVLPRGRPGQCDSVATAGPHVPVACVIGARTVEPFAVIRAVVAGEAGVPFAGSAGVAAYAGASPIQPLGTNAVSTTNGRLPASIVGTLQYACASTPRIESSLDPAPAPASKDPSPEPAEPAPPSPFPPEGMPPLLPLPEFDEAMLPASDP